MALLVEQFAGEVSDIAAGHMTGVKPLIEQFVDGQTQVALQVKVLSGPEVGMLLPNKIRMPLTDERGYGDSGYERVFQWFHF